jgi:hypothetical protein
MGHCGMKMFSPASVLSGNEGVHARDGERELTPASDDIRQALLDHFVTSNRCEVQPEADVADRGTIK